MRSGLLARFAHAISRPTVQVTATLLERVQLALANLSRNLLQRDQRWYIEVFFKILKSGCKVEELQLEHVDRIENALAFYQIIAWRVLYLTMLGRECPELPCDLVFEEQEWQAVYIVTKKEQPPETPPSIDEIIRMIASYGGFLNRKGDGFPGPQTIWIGLQRCQDFVLGVEAQKATGARRR